MILKLATAFLSAATNSSCSGRSRDHAAMLGTNHGGQVYRHCEVNRTAQGDKSPIGPAPEPEPPPAPNPGPLAVAPLPPDNHRTIVLVGYRKN
jgi:hypothetical protein